MSVAAPLPPGGEPAPPGGEPAPPGEPPPPTGDPPPLGEPPPPTGDPLPPEGEPVAGPTPNATAVPPEEPPVAPAITDTKAGAPDADNTGGEGPTSRQSGAPDNLTQRPKQIIPPINNYTINLLTLTDEESLILKTVLDKDEQFMLQLDARIRLLRKEIVILRDECLAKPTEKDPTDLSRKCIRCRRKLGIWRAVVPLVDHGMICQRCRFRVCRDCRHKQANGRWLCALCVRYRELKILTGSWVNMFPDGLNGTEIMRLSFSDSDYYRHKLLERSKRKKKKKKSIPAKLSGDTKRSSKRKSEKHKKTSKSGRKSKAGKSDKKGKKDKKGGKRDKKDKKKDRHKSMKNEDVKKSKKHPDKKGKKDGKKDKSGKPDKKKKHGKNKSKNARKHGENTNASYTRDDELDRGAGTDIELGNPERNELASKRGVLPRRKSSSRSVRHARTGDHHLRWQDESADTRILQDNAAWDVSNANFTSSKLILEENYTNKCKNNREPGSFDATVMSRGGHNSELSRRVHRSRKSDSEREERHKHRSHKTRRRIHDMLSSDYTLNENKDWRNLNSSEMLIDQRDRFLTSELAEIYFFNPAGNNDEVACRNTLSINNVQTEDFLRSSRDFVDTGYYLTSSEQRHEIRKLVNSHTEAVRLKQSRSNYKDETYTLNTEAPDGEWEKQCCEPGDGVGVNPKGFSSSTEDGHEFSEARKGDCAVRDSCSSRDNRKENTANPLYERSSDLLTGKSHTSGFPETKNKSDNLQAGKSNESLLSTTNKNISANLLTGKSNTSLFVTDTKRRSDNLHAGNTHTLPFYNESKFTSDLQTGKGHTSILSSETKVKSSDLPTGTGHTSLLSSGTNIKSSDLLTEKGQTSFLSTETQIKSSDLLTWNGHISLPSTETQIKSSDLPTGTGQTSLLSTETNIKSSDLLTEKGQTSLLSSETNIKSSDLTTGKSHTSLSSTETKYISSPSTSKEPATKDDLKRPLNGRRGMVSSLRNSRLVKRITSLVSTILDYNASAVGIRMFGRIKDINENYKVHRIPHTVERDSNELEQLLKGPPQERLPMVDKKELFYPKTKSKFNLGEVLLKAKEQRLEQQKQDQQQKQAKVAIKRMKKAMAHKESQTENKRSLASKLCPFCRIRIEFRT